MQAFRVDSIRPAGIAAAARMRPRGQWIASRPSGLLCHAAERGVSFAEIIAVIGALAVISAVLVTSIIGALPGVQSSTAAANLQMLNRAVLRFNQTNWELALAVEPGTADEERVFRSLQYRSATDPAPGSPYLPPTLGAVGTTDETTYRAVWNGHMFELAKPGTSTPGLDLLRMVETDNEAHFGEGFKPVGAR